VTKQFQILVTAKVFLIIFIFMLVFLAGCSVPGSSGMPVVDDSVEISGRVSIPTVSSGNFLAAVGEENSADAFARFIASSSCIVNGRAVEFSLHAETRELKIEKLLPAAAFNVQLQCGSLKLRSFVANTGRRLVLPLGMSLRSTADWYIRDTLARNTNLALDQFNDYVVKSSFLDSLAGTMQDELQKTGTVPAAYEKLIVDTASATLNGKSVADCMQRSGSVFNYNGEYAGKVFYYACNSSGQPVLAVQSIASMTCSHSGNTVTGSFSIEPIAVMPLVEKPGIQSPSKTAFAFTGTVSSSCLTFVRKGSLGPLAGKNIDSWLIFPVRNGLAIKAENLDNSYFTGIVTSPGEFILQKQ
jgi:hypothetical protein